MDLAVGQFVFLKDSYISKHFPIYQNKTSKPYFFVFDINNDLISLVPVTSDKTNKYHNKYNEYQSKATKDRPNYIALGRVDDIDSAFKLSNIFIANKEDIDHIYYSKKYGFYPISKIEGKKIIRLAKEYWKTNETNINIGLTKIID